MPTKEVIVEAGPLLLSFLGYLQANGKLKGELLETQAKALVSDFIEQQRGDAQC